PFFFFSSRRRHTRFSRDWSSDVCSSDLKPHPQADELRASDADVVIHSRYLVNVASTNNRIRIPSRKLVAQDAKMAAELGAFGLVVHGGHVRRGEDPQVGIDNWRKLFERAVDSPLEVPILVENTAGGDGALR